MEDIIIVGFGGHAKSIADSIEREGKYHIVGYSDLKDCKSKYKYLGTDEILKSVFDSGVKKAVVGIGYLGKSNCREIIYHELKEIGFELPVIIDPSAIVSKSASIGEGTFIGKMVIINAEASIGKMSIINTNAIIEHECSIGDFAHISVSAVVCGQVRVGEGAFVGANSTIIQCIEVDKNCIIPAGETIR